MFNEMSINILFVLCACANDAVIVKRIASLSVPWCGDEALTMYVILKKPGMYVLDPINRMLTTSRIP